MATTQIISIPQAIRNGVFQGDVPLALPAGIKFASLEVVLDLADKLAVGNVVDLASLFAPTFGGTYIFGNGFLTPNSWVSYGPGGQTITDPFGNVFVNRNPHIDVPLLARVDQFIRGRIELFQPLNAGLIITTTT